MLDEMSTQATPIARCAAQLLNNGNRYTSALRTAHAFSNIFLCLESNPSAQVRGLVSVACHRWSDLACSLLIVIVCPRQPESSLGTMDESNAALKEDGDLSRFLSAVSSGPGAFTVVRVLKLAEESHELPMV